jgi:hypothetical protein
MLIGEIKHDSLGRDLKSESAECQEKYFTGVNFTTKAGSSAKIRK